MLMLINSHYIAPRNERLEKLMKSLFNEVGIMDSGRSGTGFSKQSQVIAQLIEDHRDFFEMSDKNIEQIVSAGQAVMSKLSDDYLDGRISAENLWIKVFQACTKMMSDLIVKNIENQTAVKGVKPNSPGWIKRKGHDQVGRYSGQLINAIKNSKMVFNK